MKEQTIQVANNQFEFLIDLLYSNQDIAYHINTTLKSLTKLAFSNYLSSNYKKVLLILEDILKLILSDDVYDRDYLIKMKQFKERVQQISHK